ncbi:hypothetical protein F5X98DRAFT_339704 [Xylaria grammica]|nr:hypothetical protein F5X98DRAFT_339704 [Xylaria grammica]
MRPWVGYCVWITLVFGILPLVVETLSTLDIREYTKDETSQHQLRKTIYTAMSSGPRSMHNEVQRPLSTDIHGFTSVRVNQPSSLDG